MNEMNLAESKQGVAVYCASSPTVDGVYVEAARRLGELLAEAGLTTVCGGGRAGLMAAVISGANARGGKTIGVIPDFMVAKGWNNPAMSEMIVTDSMHTRKQTMASLTRGAIALPGGCGTLDELFEIMTWRQLGLYQGLVVIVNVNGYYDPLVEMLDRSVSQRFMNEDHRGLWFVTDSVEEAVKKVLEPVPFREFTQKLK